MIKVLLISIAFPPKSDPESIQVGRYVKYLSKLNLKFHILTSASPTLYMEEDSDLNYYSTYANIITKLKIFENRYLNFILRKLTPHLLQYPDSKYTFSLYNPDLKKPDIIYSRSYPLSSTLLALKFKKKWENIPWILHLSDPWITDYNGDSPATSFNKYSKKWNARKEFECFNLASKISFTSVKTINLYVEKYPQFKDKFILTPNIFDDDILNRKNPVFSKKLNIVYTGGFGEKRSPAFYLNSIREFLEENETQRSQFNFTFCGPITRENKLIFDQFIDVREIKHLGLIKYNEMINLQQNAHVLVNIDSDIPVPKQAVFFPSKLLEYFAANRRILAITNENSMTYDVIYNKFGDIICFNDKVKLKAIFKEYYNQFLLKNEYFFVQNKAIEIYGAKHNSAELKNIFQSIIS